MAASLSTLIAAVGGTIPTEIGGVDVRGMSLEDVDFVAGDEPLMFGGWALQGGALVRYYGPTGADVTLARASGEIKISAAPAYRFVTPVTGGFGWGAEGRDFTQLTGRAQTAGEAVEAALGAKI